MRNADVYVIPVFCATPQLLRTSTGTPLIDCSIKTFILKSKLEVGTPDNRAAPLWGRSYEIPVSLKQHIREISLAGVIGPDPFFIFFSIQNLRKSSADD